MDHKKNKFWNCLKAIANLFDFTVVIKFTDGIVSDFKIAYDNGLLLSEVIENETKED